MGLKLGPLAEDSGRVVAATLSGSAAEAAGLRIGDVVISVDGTPAAHLGADSLKGYLRGPIGSAVDLEVHRAASVCHFFCCQSLHLPFAVWSKKQV